jgi:hypothetical protein
MTAMGSRLCAEEAASVMSFDPGAKRFTVFADSEHGDSAIRAVASSAGARVLSVADLSAPFGKGEHGFTGDAVLVDLERDTGRPLEILLDRLDALAYASGTPVLINVGDNVLDVAAARLTAPSISLMSRATPSDWIAALAYVSAVRPLVLRDAASDDTMRLQRLADEVARIARTLAGLANAEPGTLSLHDASTTFRVGPIVTPANFGSERTVAREIRALIRVRRLRDRFFAGELFADPAWDMLLDLMAARLEGLRVAVSSLCIAAAVPPTTALRWIKTMTDHGLFVRIADPEDGRRVFIGLGEETATAMAAYLREAKEIGGLAI